MIQITNNKGMMCPANGVVITPENKIAFLSLVGAQTAVKAIWASVISRRSPLSISSCYKRFYGDGDVDYLVVKQTLAQGVHHWVLYPEPGPTAPYLLLIPLGEMSAQEQLVHLLNHHTLWPVKQEWGETLWEKGVGKERCLVQKLDTHGSLAWAYRVNPIGWDEVIDEAAREGDLVFA